MKKLIILVLFVVAIWQAWKHYPDFFSHLPSHEAVIENESSEPLSRLRMTVGGRTFVREELAPGEKAVFPFRVDRDATFELTWSLQGGAAERTWRGGLVTAGPIVARHRMTVHGDGGVIYRSEPLTPASP